MRSSMPEYSYHLKSKNCRNKTVFAVVGRLLSAFLCINSDEIKLCQNQPPLVYICEALLGKCSYTCNLATKRSD